jgi:hypothetical protein
MQLGAGDTFFVVLTGHGFVDEDTGNTYVGGVSEETLARWLMPFDPAVEIIVVINGCHSGGFVDTLASYADLTVMAANEALSSYGDLDSSFVGGLFGEAGDTNDADRGSEWLSALNGGLIELIASPGTVEMIGDYAELMGTGFWEEATARAFNVAMASDAAAQAAIDALCAELEPQPKGNAVKRSDGVDGTAAGNVDLRAVLAAKGCYGPKPGLGTCAEQAPIDPRLAAVVGSVQSIADLPCGQSLDGEVLCGTGPTPTEGEFYLLAAIVDDAVPQAGEFGLSYQYGFVFDADDDATNNFEPLPEFPDDFFRDTDLWFVGGYDSFGWTFDVTLARDGTTTSLPSGARLVVRDDFVALIVPAGELESADPRFRISTFRHTGDFGLMGGPWTGDVVPTVDQPLSAI